MSKIIKVQEGQIIEGFDNYSAEEWCTPDFWGFSLCFSVTAKGQSIILTITFKTPLGNFTESFTIDTNVCFTFSPIPLTYAELCISDFKADPKKICFTIGVKVCFDAKIYIKCSPQYTHGFCVPLPGHSLHDKLETKELSDSQLSSLILLSSLQTANEKSCNCH